MSTPNLGTYALLVAVAGLGGWTVHEAMSDTVPSTLAAGFPSTAGQSAQGLPPISLTVMPAAPPAVNLTLIPATAQEAPTISSRDRGGALAHTTGGSSPVGLSNAPESATQTVRLIWATGPSPESPTQSKGSPTGGSPSYAGSSYQVLATDGSIVFIGPNGKLVANTGHTDSSGVVALGVGGSTLASGDSQAKGASPASSPSPSTQGTTSGSGSSHANGSFLGLLPQATTGRSIAISGFEDHSVSVIGNDQIVTYDDSNVFIARNGQINANTGDTDSSGLNAVDVINSRVRSGNSGDGEGDEAEEAEEGEEDAEDEDEAVLADEQNSQRSALTSALQSTASSDDEDEQGNDEADEDGIGGYAEHLGATWATVTDEGASIASGNDSFVVGADGFDDVSIRTRGDRNIVTYDDSNVVIGGDGRVNAQIGDSDTGGAVVMGIYNSDVQAGCEGDLCYSD